MWSQGQVIGSLEAAWEPWHETTDQEEQMLEVLAGQAANAIVNARLYQEKERALRRIQQGKETLQVETTRAETLVRISRELIAASSLPVLPSRLCQLVAKAVGSDYSTTLLLNSEGTRADAIANWGHAEDRFAIIRTVGLPQEELSALLALLEKEKFVFLTADAPSDATSFPMTVSLLRK